MKPTHAHVKSKSRVAQFGEVLIPVGLLGALAGSYWGAIRFNGLYLRRTLGAVISFAVSNFWWMFFK